jgi:ribosomal protein L3
VPGPEKRLVMMRKGIRAHRKTYPVEVRKIVL